MSGDEEEISHELDIFQEPASYFTAEKQHTFDKYMFRNGEELTLRLVGSNPLWGHLVWNSSRIITDYLLTHANRFIRGKTVLELGAGAGLPAIACATNHGGATKVVVTDYPDPELIENLRFNIVQATKFFSEPDILPIVAEGYLWGANIDKLTIHLLDSTKAKGDSHKFDTLVLSDLLFNHSEHAKLANTLHMALKKSKEARALVFFTPHRPWLLQKDLAFFDSVKSSTSDEDNGSPKSSCDEKHVLGVNKILETMMEKPMFQEDRGDETLRKMVYGYEIYWANLQ